MKKLLVAVFFAVLILSACVPTPTQINPTIEESRPTEGSRPTTEPVPTPWPTIAGLEELTFLPACDCFVNYTVGRGHRAFIVRQFADEINTNINWFEGSSQTIRWDPEEGQSAGERGFWNFECNTTCTLSLQEEAIGIPYCGCNPVPFMALEGVTFYAEEWGLVISRATPVPAILYTKSPTSQYYDLRFEENLDEYGPPTEGWIRVRRLKDLEGVIAGGKFVAVIDPQANIIWFLDSPELEIINDLPVYHFGNKTLWFSVEPGELHWQWK